MNEKKGTTMKNILLVLAAVSAVIAAKADYNDIRPAKYEPKSPTAVVWQNDNDKALADATSCEALAALAATPASARALLMKLRGAYDTDPMVMMQIGALSQWVMEKDRFLCFRKPSRAAARKIWVKALVETAETSVDAYIKTLCLDQLRWCGCDCRCLVRRIYGVGVNSGDKAVEDFAAMVARELEGRAAGL